MRKAIIFLFIISYEIGYSQERLELIVDAENQLSKGDTLEAINTYKEALKKFPRSYTTTKRLAEVYYYQNDTHNGILYANIALEIAEDFFYEAEGNQSKEQFRKDLADAYHLKGLLRMKQYRFSDALKEFDQAIKIDSQNVALHMDKAMVYFQGNKIDSARYYLHKLKDIPEISSKALFTIGNSFYKEKNFDSALHYYNTVVERYPLFKTAYHYKGLVLTEMQQYLSAIEAFSKFIELDSMSEEAFFRRAVLYNEIGEMTKALNDWSRALLLNENNQETYRNRGLTYFQLGNYELAIDDFDKALAIEPKQAYTRINRGYSYYLIDQPRKALDDLNQGIEQMPRYYFGRYFRSLVHLQLKNKKAACQDIKKAVELGMKESDIDRILIKKCF